MPLTVGKRFFDQYSVICVFGSVVGCVVVPLIAQSVETLILSAILLSLTAKTLSQRSAQSDGTGKTREGKDDRRKNKEIAHPTHKVKKKKPGTHQPVYVSSEERERQRLEDLQKQDEVRQVERERKVEERKEKKARKREERNKRKQQEEPKVHKDGRCLDLWEGSPVLSGPPMVTNEISAHCQPLIAPRHQAAHARMYGGHSYARHNFESHTSSRSFSKRCNAYGGRIGARAYGYTWGPSEPSSLPVTQALAFNPQPPVPTSAPKTKAWQNPALPPRLQNQEPCWRPHYHARKERNRHGNRPMSASEQPVYSAPNSANMYENPDSLAKSLSLEDITSSSSEHDPQWVEEGTADVSPTGSNYSDHYYSLFGTEDNQSPFGLDLLTGRAANAE